MTTTIWHSGTRWTAVTEGDEDLEYGFRAVWSVHDADGNRLGCIIADEEEAFDVLRNETAPRLG